MLPALTVVPGTVSEDAGPYPSAVAIDPAGRRAFVAHDQGVRAINLVHHSVITDVRAPTATHGIACAPDRTRIWVTTRDGRPGRVWVLNGNTYGVPAILPAGASRTRWPIARAGAGSASATFTAGRWGVYDAAALTPLTTLTGFGEPAPIAVNTATNKIYVADHGTFKGVAVIHGATHAWHYIQSTNPALVLLGAYGAAVDSACNRIYVTAISQGASR